MEDDLVGQRETSFAAQCTNHSVNCMCEYLFEVSAILPKSCSLSHPSGQISRAYREFSRRTRAVMWYIPSAKGCPLRLMQPHRVPNLNNDIVSQYYAFTALI